LFRISVDAIEELIPHDKLKEQIEKELISFIESANAGYDISLPRITFEKGKTHVLFPLPFLNEYLITQFIIRIKDHLENIRIHSFSDGYYAFQALNRNLFKTENILENIKIEFSGLTSNFNAEISKKGNFTQEEINLVIEIFKTAYVTLREDPLTRLKKLGAAVYTENGNIDWSYIAGYEEVKRKIRESIILPFENPDIYDSIARLTRKTFESNRPRAILFEGSPGVGKTTVARIIAGEVAVPLIYVPIESIMSKWYGQSSQNLAQIFDASEDLEGSILFIDEIDALASSRNQTMFEATRRVLSVLLRKLDGIDAVTKTITIGATNRKDDLDHALISRFDQTIYFPLPNQSERSAIFTNYASHLSAEEANELAEICKNLSGRSIKDICELTERRWARKLIIKKLVASSPPPEYYRQTAKMWMKDTLSSK
jgi:ATP-dependent Zn protease